VYGVTQAQMYILLLEKYVTFITLDGILESRNLPTVSPMKQDLVTDKS